MRESHRKSFGDDENVSKRKPKVFWSNRKSFGENQNTIKPEMFRSASGIFWMVLEMLWDVPEFSGEPQGAANTKGLSVGRCSHWGQPPPFCGMFCWGTPLGGQPPFLVGTCCGGSPPYYGECWEGGPPGGSPLHVEAPRWKGAHLRASSPFYGALFVAPPLVAAPFMPPPPLLLQ